MPALWPAADVRNESGILDMVKDGQAVTLEAVFGLVVRLLQGSRPASIPCEPRGARAEPHPDGGGQGLKAPKVQIKLIPRDKSL